MKYIIYKVTNKDTKKSYIRRTTRGLKQRMYSHFYSARTNPKCYFHKALSKYGKECWEVSILEEDDGDENHIREREQAFILEHNTYKNGYNSTAGGEDFQSPEYQRELQHERVRQGTHPFLGGQIQRDSMLRRHRRGEFIQQNQKRVQAGTHNFLGDRNPQKALSAIGKHHNQTNAWRNTKTLKNEASVQAWLAAKQMFEWFKANGHKKRGGSYRALANEFGFKPSQVANINQYFRKGWNPNCDPDWIDFYESRQT